MIKFDRERALAGDKVITRDEREVTQIKHFKGIKIGLECIYAVIGGQVCEFYESGSHTLARESNTDLFMAPKKLSGFINVYIDKPNLSIIHTSKEKADTHGGERRIACIDLSQFEEGHGLSVEDLDNANT
jgi:hypothetical protein